MHNPYLVKLTKVYNLTRSNPFPVIAREAYIYS